MEKSQNQKIIADDVLRYRKNKLGQMMSYLGLVFNCLYIMLLYSFNSNTFYTIEIGISVLLSLVYLLACFLASEGVKVYNKSYAIFLFVLAAIQLVRIFGLPLKGLTDAAFTTTNAEKLTVARDYFGIDLSQQAAYTLLVIYLVASAACLIVAGVWSYLVSIRHAKHNKAVDEGTIDLDEVLKQVELEEAQANNAANTAVAESDGGEVQ